MKRSNQIKYIFSIIFLISISYLIYVAVTKNQNTILFYSAIFLTGFSVSVLISILSGNSRSKKIEWLESRLSLWNTISYKVKIAGENCFTQLPIGIIIFDEKKIIQWANDYAKKIFKSQLVERKISIINKDLHNKILLSNEFDLTLYDKVFNCSVLRDNNILYLLDKTNLNNIEIRYNERMQVAGIINLDNLDQALSTLDAQEKTKQISSIIGILGEWSNKHNIYLRGYSEEQYLLLMNRVQLNEIIKEQFKVMDDVQEYCYKENLRITASIGIATKDVGIVELVQLAEQQLELAMNRGGNQAVVYDNEQINYYGGKTTGVENKSPIYVRVKTEDLVEMVKASDKVVIMTHSGMDADAFGSALAIAKICRALNINSYIAFNEEAIDQTIKIVYEEIKREHIYLLDYLKDPREILSMMTDQTLLVIADCQYQQLLIDQRIYKKAKRTAILDHHRRSNTAISNYQFLYSQPSASSTIELIVEMMDFLEYEIEISPIEASYMLMGVIVDTSNLMYRTSFRTFNVLSKLQKLGAEMAKAQRYLRENFDEYIQRMTILNGLEIIDGIYGIAVCSEHEIHQRQFIAKVTDNIIAVNGIKAAFCIGMIGENEVGISARSLDEVNVQVIMERLGGGGHFNNSATQIKDITIEDAKQMLIEQFHKGIDEGGQNMKIILTKDVKGKGKTGDIIDIPSGHANFLIRGKQAILASTDNVKQLELVKDKQKVEAEKHLEEMKELKIQLEQSPITIGVNVGKEGKLFGTVSSKQIVEEFKNQYNIQLDKRKMLYEKDIDAVGTYTIVIQLHKEVKANLTINVIEKE